MNQRLANLALLSFFSLSICAQDVPTISGIAVVESQATQQVPIFRTATNLVLIDVVVRDKNGGRPVMGLDSSSFKVSEDGHRQNITVFEEHRSTDTTQASKAPMLPPHAYANFPEYSIKSAANVLLLDGLNTRVPDQLYAREQIIRYLQTIPSGTWLAVFTLGSELKMVTGFTPNLDTVIEAMTGRVGDVGRFSANGNRTPGSASPDAGTKG